MIFTRLLNLTGIALLVAFANPSIAQDVFTSGVEISDSDPGTADLFVDDYTVLDGQVCIGNGCAPGVLPASTTGLLLKSATPTVDFIDTSTSPSYPYNDWQLLVNDPGVHGLNRFSVRDTTAGTTPFTILKAAPDNTLVLNYLGHIGIGTLSPQRELHVVGSDFPAFRLEQDGAGGHTPYAWEQYIGADGTLLIWDRTAAKRRMVFSPANPDSVSAMRFDGDGDLAISDHTAAGGFDAPARLFVAYEDGTAQIMVEETDPTANPRTLLNLQNNGRPEIVMGNTATDGEWSFGAGTDFFLKTGTVGSLSSAKTKVFTVKQNGDTILTGTLTTGGTTCGGGCDAVFSDDYTLPSIADHARAMYALGHLPNMGPMPEDTPFNLTDKFGRLLNEVEHAHIYIGQLHDRLNAQQQLNAELLDRLATLEARLAD